MYFGRDFESVSGGISRDISEGLMHEKNNVKKWSLILHGMVCNLGSLLTLAWSTLPPRAIRDQFDNATMCPPLVQWKRRFDR